MISSTLIASALVVLPSLVKADLGKQSLFPDGLHDPLIAFDTIGSTPATNRASSVPQICKDYASGEAYGMPGDVACDVNGIEAREVFYEDCDQSWTLCRCPDAQLSLDQMQERFGQVPVGIRSYVGAALATAADGCSAVCFNGQFIRFHGDCPMTVFLHEAGHAFDSGFSGSQPFKDAIAADSCVPDGYGNSNEAEDWTQMNVLYTYTKQFGPLPADTACLQNQWNQLANDERINQGQDTKTCLADKRPFTVANDMFPAEPPAPPPTTAPPPPPPPPTTDAPAPPPSTDVPPPPVSTSPPNNCNSAKFRFRNKIKRAFKIATEYVNTAVGNTVTLPYSP